MMELEIEMPKIESREEEDDFDFKRSRRENVLYFDFDREDEGEKTNVCGIAKAGQIFCVMGPPGSGKTSLLKTINGNTDDLLGTISLSGMSRRDTVLQTQFVPDSDLLLPTLTAEEAIMSAVRLNMNSLRLETQLKFLIYSVVSEFGIDGILKRVVHTLSPAEKRKLNIAIAVMMNPTVLIEPIFNYGLSDALCILQTLKRLADNRKMIVIISLSPVPSILYSLCSTFMFMYRGQTVFHGTISDMKDFLEPLDKTRNINYSHVDQFYGILTDIATKSKSILFDRLMDGATRSRNEVYRRIKLLSRWYTDIDDEDSREIIRVRPEMYSVNNPKETLISNGDGHFTSYYVSDELAVIIPEIKNNTYGVLTFCISKTISDIPLTVLQPVVFLTVIYWVANLHGLYSYLGSIGVLIINIVATQSLGLVIGSLFMLPWNVTVMALTLLSMMLLGGAFNTPPAWIRWTKYLSIFDYGVDAFAVLEFQNAESIVCSSGSIYPPCILAQNSSLSSIHELPSDSVLTMLGITWGVEVYTGVLCAITVILRVIWFFILHWKATRSY
ncbi:hypothetical protein FSP39_020790 [Pinctada imbricata]|uniref:ABC transporter domain-containing protein n=1 Tax=Pinctada imbricata TaxID=66713 RepID=A0AA88Y5N0_PINIB|nr:hypothetical protein FSP39_020790 [Pinctada imbricata]